MEDNSKQPISEQPIDETLAEAIKKANTDIITQMHTCVIGQDSSIRLLLVALLAGGHVILHGVPGLAKTLIVSTLAKIFDVEFNRIQFTPDLMPADIIGTEMLSHSGYASESNPASQADALRFTFRKGPIFANIILADEINRTPPKTQSALLEAMQENAVTAYGKRYPLDYPFFVFATQNPIEQEGTYTLPEAQLDRFLFNIEMEYPSEEEEIKIAAKKTYFDLEQVQTVLTKEELRRFQNYVEKILVADSMLAYVVRIVKNSRPASTPLESIKKYVQYGAGPRASQYIVIAAKAHAALEGRTHVKREDVRKVAYPILNHRLILNFSAHAEHISSHQLIEELIHAAED